MMDSGSFLETYLVFPTLICISHPGRFHCLVIQEPFVPLFPTQMSRTFTSIMFSTNRYGFSAAPLLYPWYDFCPPSILWGLLPHCFDQNWSSLCEREKQNEPGKRENERAAADREVGSPALACAGLLGTAESLVKSLHFHGCLQAAGSRCSPAWSL